MITRCPFTLLHTLFKELKSSIYWVSSVRHYTPLIPEGASSTLDTISAL